MASFDDEFNQLKTAGNSHYSNNKFEDAELTYSELLLRFPDRERAILLTNRAAARLNLGRLQEAVDDADAAIIEDAKWMKAYYRKSVALDRLGRYKEAYECWVTCAEHCDPGTSPWLSEMVVKARDNWIRIFRQIPIVDENDFMERYELLEDSRDKLSTLAHFWNASTFSERYNHFRFFLTVIGGESDMSQQNQGITEDMMMAMPLHNYTDKLREGIELWCQFFESLDPQSKTVLLVRIWGVLTSTEQHAVIVDLRLFVSMGAAQAQNAEPKTV